jgi:CheY-like chemotaxis protein
MPRTALIIDDNRALAEDLAEILEAEGYQTRTFNDPELALHAAHELDFDVALLDVRMPGMDGVTLQRLLIEKRPSARFVLMTAYADDERLSSGLAAGLITRCDSVAPTGIAGTAVKLMQKPFPPETLLRTLAELSRGGQ